MAREAIHSAEPDVELSVGTTYAPGEGRLARLKVGGKS